MSWYRPGSGSGGRSAAVGMELGVEAARLRKVSM